jgi:hypothetical protein
VLASAGDGFDQLGARWEHACTELSLAEALTSAGRADEARSALDAATTVFKDLRSLPELEQARGIAERL